MIHCDVFYNQLHQNGISFFTGVPDSLLKDICLYITEHTSAKDHIITPNEGNAIALATGYYLATQQVPLVYMQNSGFGNCVNPLTSLTDPEVYGIPMVLLMGWRGEPNVKDEPQHVKMGRINLPLLDTMEIPYTIVPDNESDCEGVIQSAIAQAKNLSAPVALVVKKGTFEKYNTTNPTEEVKKYSLQREEAISIVLNALPNNAITVGTTGKLSRELYEHRDVNKAGHDKDFLTVGAMGHASHIALGLALNHPQTPVYCFDGDGAALMHLGGLASVGVYGSKNLRHLVFNNVAHESVGGQPTIADKISITQMAKACGYKNTLRVQTQAELNKALTDFLPQDGPILLEIMVAKGSRDDLIRPKSTPKENKIALMSGLQS